MLVLLFLATIVAYQLLKRPLETTLLILFSEQVRIFSQTQRCQHQVFAMKEVISPHIK